MGFKHRTGYQQFWVQLLILSLNQCVTIEQTLSHFVPQFPQLLTGVNETPLAVRGAVRFLMVLFLCKRPRRSSAASESSCTDQTAGVLCDHWMERITQL